MIFSKINFLTQYLILQIIINFHQEEDHKIYKEILCKMA